MPPSRKPAATRSGARLGGTRKSIGHEHELRRDREPDPDLEPHPRREGVRDDEGRDEERRCSTRRVGEERKWNGDREEAEGSDRRDDEIAPDETRRGALSRRFDQLDGFEVGRRLNPARGRSCRSSCHSQTIGAARAVGFPRTRDSAVRTRTSLDQVRQPRRIRREFDLYCGRQRSGDEGLAACGCGLRCWRSASVRRLRTVLAQVCSLARTNPERVFAPWGDNSLYTLAPERLARRRRVRLVALRCAGHPAEQQPAARLVLALHCRAAALRRLRRPASRSPTRRRGSSSATRGRATGGSRSR